MPDRLANRVRIEQTIHELDTIGGQISRWIRHRRAQDRTRQYTTQLNVLESTFSGCLKGLRLALEGIDETRPVGHVYADCRAHDRRLALVGRLWDYFRAKFDQRDDPRLGPVLMAADEVVWSCYAEVVRNAARLSGRQDVPQAAPLPYIEPEYAPRAVTRDEPPPELRADARDPLLRELLGRLPVPVVGLPLICVEAPWWLVYIGHEVGHHLQNDLVPDWGLVDSFGRLLGSTALGAPRPTDAAAQRWQRWGNEIFADICSICSSGTWAVWAMAELELADELTMSTSNRVRYPSPVVRLALLAEVADQLGIDGRAALHGIDLRTLADGPGRGNGVVAEDLQLVPRMAGAAVGHSLGSVGSFQQLYAWQARDFLAGGRVEGWAQALRTPALLFPEQSLRAARLLIAGAVAAWAEVAQIPDRAERADATAALRETLLPVLTASREEGTRAATPRAVPDAQALGEELAGLLLQRVPDRPVSG